MAAQYLTVKLSSEINFKCFNYCLLDVIYCVRWSPKGDIIFSASYDVTVALLDYKSGKKLYTGRTPGEVNIII